MANHSLLLCFEDELAIARQVADAAGIELAVIERHHFPDGELKLRLPGAAAHALEQWQNGYRNFPFYPLELTDDPAKQEAA